MVDDGLDMASYSGWLETQRSSGVALASEYELLVTRLGPGFLLAGWDGFLKDGWDVVADGLSDSSVRLRFQPGFWLKNGSVLLVY